jgi:GNAT superfamily N-acetyltransferase
MGANGRDGDPESPVRRLPGGLELRRTRLSDVDQVADLLAARGDANDAVDLRLLVDDGDGLDAVAVVVDGDRVVSTATLLDECLTVSDAGQRIDLPAGQVELVATDPAYERRGLVRSLMTWAHERSAERGHVLQVMIGIPYFYRLFGYEYAVDIAPARRAQSVPPGDPTSTFRRAGADDLAAIGGLQREAQASSVVTMNHSEPCWRWLLGGTGTTTWVVEREGRVVASGRTVTSDDSVVLGEAAAEDGPAVAALVRGAADLVDGGEVRVVDRPGTVLTSSGAVPLAPDGGLAEQYYVRLPEPAVVLDRLRPILQARVEAAGLDRSDDVVISTFGRHYRLPVSAEGRDGGVLGAIRAGGVMQAPGAVGGCGVAPDALATLLFGPLGMHGLSRRRADVYPGPDDERFETLFPPLTSDVLTWYFPY